MPLARPLFPPSSPSPQVDDGPQGSGVASINCTMTASFLAASTGGAAPAPPGFTAPTGALQNPCPNPARCAPQGGISRPHTKPTGPPQTLLRHCMNPPALPLHIHTPHPHPHPPPQVRLTGGALHLHPAGP